MVEVVYHCGEAGALEPPLALTVSELLTLDLSLNQAELGLEALDLLVMTVVSLDLAKQPPVWKGCDTVAEGEVRGGGAFKESPEPTR